MYRKDKIGSNRQIRYSNLKPVDSKPEPQGKLLFTPVGENYRPLRRKEYKGIISITI